MSYAQDVQRMIAGVGQTVTVRHKVGASTFDPHTMQNSLSYTDATAKASVRQYKPNQVAGIVQQGDREVRIAALSLPFTPEEQDKVVISGATFTVISVNTRSPQDVPAIHIIQVRG